jgi:arginase
LAPVPTDRILIAGVRDLDNQEESLLTATSVTLLSGDQARAGTPVAEAIELLRERCDLVMMHIDLDVLDPELVPSSSTPSPFGLDVRTVATMADAAFATNQVAATVISSLNPGGGQLGQRSLATALDLIGRISASWTETPDAGAA